MKIAVDVDGVILDSMAWFVRYFNRKYNASYCQEDATQWGFFTDWNIEEEEFYEIFHTLFRSDKVAPLMDENIPTYLRQLNNSHRVDIVSARNPRFKYQLRRKLEKHHIKEQVHYGRLVVVKEKPDALKVSLGYDLYIDDNPNLVPAILKCPNATLLLFCHPWNAHVDVRPMNVIRVANWEEIMDYLS